MLNIRIALVLFFIGFGQTISGQIKAFDSIAYITYKIKGTETHELIVVKDDLLIKIPKRHMFPEFLYKLNTEKKGANYQSFVIVEPAGEGIFVKPLIVSDFENTEIKIVSKKEFLLEKKERPYLKKKYVDSIIKKNHTVFMVNEEALILSDTINFREYIDPKLDNPKKPKIKVLDGKEGYDKYGVIGIKGVIEFYDKKKCKKKKK